MRSEPPEVRQEKDAKLFGLPGTLVNCGNKFGAMAISGLSHYEPTFPLT